MKIFEKFGYKYDPNDSIGSAWIKLFRRSDAFGDCFIVAFYPIDEMLYKCSFESPSRHREITVRTVQVGQLNTVLMSIENMLK